MFLPAWASKNRLPLPVYLPGWRLRRHSGIFYFRKDRRRSPQIIAISAILTTWLYSDPEPRRAPASKSLRCSIASGTPWPRSPENSCTVTPGPTSRLTLASPWSASRRFSLSALVSSTWTGQSMAAHQSSIMRSKSPSNRLLSTTRIVPDSE